MLHHRYPYALALAGLVSPLAFSATAVAATTSSVERTLSDTRISESSGLARSTYDRQVLWTHNDSGDSARVFGVDESGSTRSVLKLSRTRNTDFEDIASGPDHTLWIADIGDDSWNRGDVQIYRIQEPSKLKNDTVAATRYDFTYADGARNAETVLVHPETGRVYVVSRDRANPGFYAAPERLSTRRANVLTRVADAPADVTGGTFTPDGEGIVLTSSTSLYTMGSAGSTVLDRPSLRESGSVEVTADGRTILFGHEGRSSKVYQQSMPQAGAASPPGTTQTEPQTQPDTQPTPEPETQPTPELETEPTPEPETQPTPEPEAALADWQLQYATDFTSVDDWRVYDGQTQNNDNSVNLAKNVTAGANGLVIEGKQEAGHSRPFTSGEIVGKGTQVVPNHFRAEVTGTFEDISGIWPALLWFRPNNASDGEIDVMEWMGGGTWTAKDPRVAITMHNEYGATQDSIKKPLVIRNHAWYDPNAEHTYTIEKVPGSITIWIDGHQISTFTAADKGWWNRIMEVPNRTWYPRITLQIGAGSATKVVPNPDSSFRSTAVEVTSLKLWKYTG